VLLRELRGGSLEAEITSGCYSPENLAFITGSDNGTVSYWNFENAKLEFTYFEEDCAVNSVAVAFPFKVILSLNVSGYLIAWKM
jgi:hypothetical protein